MDVALVVMQSGGSTVMAERTFFNVLKGYKLAGVSAVWRLDFVVATCLEGGSPSTVLRLVGDIGVNLSRASAAALLGERMARGEVTPVELVSEIERIRTLASPYNRWVMVAAAAATAACFSRIPGGDWGAFWIAFVAAGTGQLFRSWLQQTRTCGTASVLLRSGILSACLAGIGVRQGWTLTLPATAIASVIYMVPGLPLINGFIDMVSNKHVFVGVERILRASFLFLVLAIAIAFAMAVIL